MGHERPNKSELDEGVIGAYAKSFIPRHDVYPIQLANGTFVSVHKELSDNVVAAHFKGYLTLGTYALDPRGWAKWICFDADDDKGWKGIRRLAERLEKVSVLPYLELSRRGGHLWLFTPSIPGFQARRFGRQLLTEYKVRGIELYPKQDKPKTGPGSLVRLPLGIHRMTGKQYHFVDLKGEPIAPTIRQQIQVLASPQVVPQPFIDEILARAPDSKSLSPAPSLLPKSETIPVGSVSERIKSSIGVRQFVGQFVALDVSGRGHCPFHDDEHMSFQVSDEGNFWNCYAGCGGGSIIDFWMRWRAMHHEKGDFKSTIRDLAKRLL